jgi:exodeoxyribonuclease VII small subunit
MKKVLNYNEAYKKLEQLVENLEEGDIQLEQLAATVKQANELIEICETKLRKIDGDVKDAITNLKP